MKNQTIICINKSIEIKSSNLKDILCSFKILILSVFEDFVKQALSFFAEEYFNNGELKNILKCNKVTWKSKTGFKTTQILTIFGKINVPQIQVTADGKRIFITRILLGLEKRKRIPQITIEQLGLIGALSPYRVTQKIVNIFSGVKLSLMTILRSVRKLGEIIKFDIDEGQQGVFDADGTGLPILNSGKRGKELKILAQRKKSGGIQVSGMIIGGYNRGWDKLFKPLKEKLKVFKEIVLTTDGDDCILKGINGIKVILQRCLFHIPHQAKYTLWQDKIVRKSKEWVYILTKLIEICNVKKIKEDESIAKETVENKKNEIKELIEYCKNNKAIKTAEYLENASLDMFSGIEKKVYGLTTSLLERMMRTINQRINVGQWSESSALSICKIRGAYYYNGFNVE